MSATPRRVAVLFSGGPAPAANAVISAAVMAFRRDGWEVVGLHDGYAHLIGFDPATPLVEGEHYRIFRDADLWGLRNHRGVILGTARAHPGRGLAGADLTDASKTKELQRVLAGLRSLGVEALVSIGGDGTLMTANALHRVQDHLDGPRVRVVHLPKTIDNDYQGIDFTFGFFTAVDVIAKELLNLRADARATGRYYVAEVMGRRAGWLAYGVSVAGEAHMVVAVEDLHGSLVDAEGHLSLDALAARVADLVEARATKGKRYGVVVLAEGLVEHLPPAFLASMERDAHGHVSLGQLEIGKLVARHATERLEARGGPTPRLVGVQLGYEARCAAPHAFDVMLGTQLGMGAWRALVEEGHDAVMVSISGQLDLRYVPFTDLVDAQSLRTAVRYLSRGSDMHRLAHALATRLPPP